MSSYSRPPWAHKPEYEWRLVEIKGGLEVAVHRLDQTQYGGCTLLGRAADQVDIVLQHESASRIHARIAFDKTGMPWLRDLQSTHGVTVNKKRLPKSSIGKVESNSTKPGARGVVLYPGDILQFAESTRIYCLEGPPEFARGAIRKVSVPAASAIAVPPTDCEEASSPQQRLDGDRNYDHPEDDAEIREELKDDNIPENHQKEWEKLKALRYKLDNVRTESDRIRAKASVAELTTGQEKQLERNEEKITNLERDIGEKEEELHRMLFPDRKITTEYRTTKGQHGTDDDDDDEFYDRTKRNNKDDQLQMEEDGETEESLKSKWKNLREQRQTTIEQLARVSDKQAYLEQRVTILQESGDEETFFVQNDLDMVRDSKRKLVERKRILEGNLSEAERLLRVVNPHLKPDIATGSLGETMVPTSSQAKEQRANEQITRSRPLFEQLPKENTERETSVKRERDDGTSTGLNTDPVLPVPMPRDKTLEQGGEASKGFMMPPPSKKRPRVVGPAAMPPPSLSTSKAKRDGSGKPPKMGTLAALASLTSTSSGRKGAAQATADKKSKNDKSHEGEKAAQLSAIEMGKQDVWQAPKDQDGSGNTKLNAKFAGRY